MFERIKLLAKDEFGCDIVKSKRKSSFEELFGFNPPDPETAQKLHEARKKIPLYFEPFEMLQPEGEKQDVQQEILFRKN